MLRAKRVLLCSQTWNTQSALVVWHKQANWKKSQKALKHVTHLTLARTVNGVTGGSRLRFRRRPVSPASEIAKRYTSCVFACHSTSLYTNDWQFPTTPTLMMMKTEEMSTCRKRFTNYGRHESLLWCYTYVTWRSHVHTQAYSCARNVNSQISMHTATNNFPDTF